MSDHTTFVIGIMTCHNRREQTLAALRSWFGQNRRDVTLGAVVVDDGSSDGTAAAVTAEFPDVTVVPGSGTLFWAAGMALAESHARGRDPDALVWLNDDVLLDEDCLLQLMEVSASCQPPAVVTGALADPDTLQATYGAFAPSRWHPLRGTLVRPVGHPVPVRAVHGNVLYVPRAAYQLLQIDGAFEHAYADLDYGLRLTQLRHPVLLTPGTVGRCSRITSSRHLPDAGRPLRERLRRLNSPRGLPWRSHVRFLRRHGGPLWPILAAAPQVKELLRGPAEILRTPGLGRVAAKGRAALSMVRHHPGAAARPVRFLIRLATWRALTAVGADAVVPFRHYRLRFWCPSEWRGMSKLAYALRDEYEAELRHLAKWVSPDDLVVDVGAHYGTYTVCLGAVVGPGGLVLAVEPSRHARAVLDRNVRLNKLSMVRVIPAALGEEADRRVLQQHEDRSRASLAEPGQGGLAGAGEDVEVVRLDDVVPTDRRVAFIKIDVEGHELPALRGALRVLERDRPAVLFEYQPVATGRAGLPHTGAWDLLSAQGYRFHEVRGDGRLVAVKHPAALTGQNVLALPA